MSVKNHDPKLEGMSDLYIKRLEEWREKGKSIRDAIVLAQADIKNWLKEKLKVSQTHEQNR